MTFRTVVFFATVLFFLRIKSIILRLCCTTKKYKMSSVSFIVTAAGSVDPADVKLQLDCWETKPGFEFSVADYFPRSGFNVGNPFDKKGVNHTYQSLLDFANLNGFDVYKNDFSSPPINAPSAVVGFFGKLDSQYVGWFGNPPVDDTQFTILPINTNWVNLDSKNKKLVYSVVNGGATDIFIADYNGSNPVSLVTGAVNTELRQGIDPINKRVFYGLANGDIRTVSYEGGDDSLYLPQIDPLGLTFVVPDVQNGYLFYVKVLSSNYHLFRSDLDGSNEILITSAGVVSQVFLVPELGYVYARVGNTSRRYNYDGTGEINSAVSSYPHAYDLVTNKVYRTGSVDKILTKTDPDFSNPVVVFTPTNGALLRNVQLLS